MVPSPRPWSIAFVEDDDDMRRQVKEYLEGETFTFGKVEVAETYDTACVELARHLPLFYARHSITRCRLTRIGVNTP